MALEVEGARFKFEVLCPEDSDEHVVISMICGEGVEVGGLRVGEGLGWGGCGGLRGLRGLPRGRWGWGEWGCDEGGELRGGGVEIY